MRKILPASIFVLTFSIFAFGQTQSRSDCPTISITEPASAVPPGENMVFTANVSGIDLNKIEYQWYVSKGEIIQGQGTNSIEITNLKDSTPTVTVEIKGLDERCINTASQTARIFDPPHLILIDEFELSKNTDTEFFNRLVAEIKNDPTSMIYIIVYANNKNALSESKNIERNIKKRFAEEDINFNKIVIVNGKDNSNLMRVFIVPQGATPPTP